MAADDVAFLGHPRGLGWLAGTEMWERFSYYGMQGLLVLYMVHRLLLPEHAAHVWGFAAFQAAIEAAYGPLSTQELASAIFGLYAGFVWMTPILGGLLADRVTGRTPAVVAGGLLMAAGHFLMAFDATFLLALCLLLAGVGLFKGNLATQVGGLYAADDARRASAYQIYYLAIQLAVIVTPLVCGTLGEIYGWHWGFGAAGIGMVVGVAVYLRGLRWLGPDAKVRRAGGHGVVLTRAEWRRVGVLVALIPLCAVATCATYQTQNMYPLWAERTLDLHVAGLRVPVTWLQSVDAAATSSAIVVSLLFWRWWARRWAEPDDITKMVLGTGLMVLAPLVLAVASWRFTEGGSRVSLAWVLPYEGLTALGIMNFMPVGLGLYARAAPSSISATMIGAFYLNVFLANVMVGWAGGYLDRVSGAVFWGWHAGVTAVAGVVLVGVRGVVGRELG